MSGLYIAIVSLSAVIAKLSKRKGRVGEKAVVSMLLSLKSKHYNGAKIDPSCKDAYHLSSWPAGSISSLMAMPLLVRTAQPYWSVRKY